MIAGYLVQIIVKNIAINIKVFKKFAEGTDVYFRDPTIILVCLSETE